MKARVKATGVIVDVTHSHNITSGGVVMKKIYQDQLGNEYSDSELEFLQEGEYIHDYWTRLEHQYAGMAMQQLVHLVNVGYEYVYEETAIIAMNFAHALVEKLKEEEKK